MDTSNIVESFTSIKLSKEDKLILKQLISITGLILVILIIIYLILATFYAYNKFIVNKSE
jgi:hypothetical protein